MRRIVALALAITVYSVTLAQAAPRLQYEEHAPPGAQAEGMSALWRVCQVDPQAGQTPKTAVHGMMEGAMFAENVPTGGTLATGLIVGCLSGLIGTGIGYFIIGPGQLTPAAQIALMKPEASADYQMAFRQSYDKKSRSRKRNTFLGGGILGTLIFVVIVAGGS